MINLNEIFKLFCHKLYFLSLRDYTGSHPDKYLTKLFLKFLEMEYNYHKRHLNDYPEIETSIKVLCKYLSMSTQDLKRLTKSDIAILLNDEYTGTGHISNPLVKTLHLGLTIPEVNDLKGRKRYLRRIKRFVDSEVIPFKVTILMAELK